MNAQLDLRPSPIAGRWYPANPGQLAKSVDQYIQKAVLPELDGELVALVTPHAGHRYSGPVAGYAFAAAQGQTPELVVVVSPLHSYHPQPLLTSGHDAYETPLGTAIIDRQAVSELEDEIQTRLGVSLARVRFDEEHALEIELPFLQRALAGVFRLLPVMVRETSVPVVRELGMALAEVARQRQALLIASTDLSHFYSQSVAAQFDQEILRCIEALDPEGVLQAEEEGKGFACGRGALAAVLWAAQELGADHARVVRYATSGDITGDYAQVVGYAAAVITRPV